MSTATTFRVSFQKPEEVEAESFRNSNYVQALKSIPETLPHYKRNKCTEVLQGTEFSQETRFTRNNGFVNTVFDCYNYHYNLVLRPDDIWIAIMTQFSFYVNANAEEFRGKFVNFEGKKTLAVMIPDSLRSAPYDLFVKLMTKEIDRNLVDPEVKSWILPSFSTTTEDDLVSAGVIFMATMKKYFDYKCYMMCGIPFVTLEGTLADWEDIRSRLDKLEEYKLEKWVGMLRPILDQFVRAKKGEADLDFWQRICNYHRGGSGPDYISGWISAFCVFDEDGKWQGDGRSTAEPTWPVINTGNIPTGVVEVDVTIDDNGALYYSSMFAGHIAYEIQGDNKTLKPSIGWVICLKPEDEAELDEPEAEPEAIDAIDNRFHGRGRGRRAP